jgi:hypothetical protein
MRGGPEPSSILVLVSMDVSAFEENAEMVVSKTTTTLYVLRARVSENITVAIPLLLS